MVRVRPTKTISLEKYGQQGEVVIATPGITDRNWEEDMMGNVATTRNEKGEFVVSGPNIGTLQFIHVLSFVRSAPFERSYGALVAFLDQMDEVDFGSAQEFWDELSAAVSELEANPGPLPHSA